MAFRFADRIGEKDVKCESCHNLATTVELNAGTYGQFFYCDDCANQAAFEEANKPLNPKDDPSTFRENALGRIS